MTSKPRLLIFIVAYFAERTIAKVLSRVPPALADSYDVEVLVIDDASRDETFTASFWASRSAEARFPITVLHNSVNQGYGGNQKIGYHSAIQHGFAFVALLHGDGQYATQRLPALV